MSGWGNLFGKIADQFQGRIERLKNEKEKLLNERSQILSGPVSDSRSERVVAINTRLQSIETALTTKASD